MSDGRYNFAAFTTKVIERAKALWPDGEATVEGHNVTITRPGTGDPTEMIEIRLQIGRAYRSYWSDGDLEGTLSRMFEPLSLPPLTRELIQERAMLKFDHFKINSEDVREHWIFAANPEGVVITGVADFPGTMHFFRADSDPPELEKYGVTREELWAWGMANLRTLVATFTPQHLVFNEGDWRGEEIWVVTNGSGYASAALLCHDLIDAWMPPALRGYTWVAGIPDRDTLIIARPETPSELLASAMANGRATGLYPFDWTIYAVQQGAIVNFWGTLTDDQARAMATEIIGMPPTRRTKKRK